MRTLVVDLGSTSVKGALVAGDRPGVFDQVATRAFPAPRDGLPLGWFEVDPPRVLAVVESLLDELLAGTSREPFALLFSSQMGGVLLADQANRPLTPYLSWRDQRAVGRSASTTRTTLDVVRERMGDDGFGAVGRELQPGSATTLLAWLVEHGQPPANARALSLGDWVAAALTGAPPIADPTTAIGSYDLATGDWARAVFERLGIDRFAWPRLGTWKTPVGETTRDGRRMFVHPAVGDHQASLRGVDLRLGELSVNVSTGSQVGLLTRELALGPWQTRAFFDGLKLNAVTHLPAGRALEALVRLATELGGSEADPWPAIVAAAEQSPPSELAVDLTFFAGPLGDRGSIREISVDNLTLGGVFRAAFASMADNYARCAVMLSPHRDWERVVLSGGMTRKIPQLRSFILDRLGGSHREVPAGDDALLGLASLGRTLDGAR